MLKHSALLLAGLASVSALGQHRCLYRTDEGGFTGDLSTSPEQVVFDGPRAQAGKDEDFTLISSLPGYKHIENPVLTSSKDNVAVHLAVANWVEDLRKVTGVKLDVYNDTLPGHVKQAVIVGTADSELIGGLEGYDKVREGLKGKWESFDVRVLQKPRKGLDKAAVIAGSDRVGALPFSLNLHVAG